MESVAGNDHAPQLHISGAPDSDEESDDDPEYGVMSILASKEATQLSSPTSATGHRSQRIFAYDAGSPTLDGLDGLEEGLYDGSPQSEILGSSSGGSPSSGTEQAAPPILDKQKEAGDIIEFFKGILFTTTPAAPANGTMIENGEVPKLTEIESKEAIDRHRQLFILFLLFLNPKFRNIPVLGQRMVDANILTREVFDDALRLDLSTTLQDARLGMGGVVQDLYNAAATYAQSNTTSSTQNSRCLSEFEDFRFIGRGAFGQVYSALHKLDGVEYAIKAVPIPSAQSNTLESLQREIQALAVLEHKHCVRYYSSWIEYGNLEWSMNTGGSTAGSPSTQQSDWTESDSESQVSCVSAETSGASIVLWKPQVPPPVQVRGTMFIQMQLCTSQTLAHWLNDEAARKAAGLHNTALNYFRQIVCGLDHVHSQGLIHRDLKPGNIFFCSDGSIKIGDFGLSVRQQPTSEGQSTALVAYNTEGERTKGVGTPSYASPEQLKGCIYTNAADIFSLGIILFEMLHPMFTTAMERAAMFGEVRKGNVPGWLCQKLPLESAQLRRMLSSCPEDRPTTKDLLKSALVVLQLNEDDLVDQSALKQTIREQDDAIKALQNTVVELIAQLESKQKDNTDLNFDTRARSHSDASLD